MALDIPVFDEEWARIKMGSECPAMHRCPECELQNGVFISRDHNAKVIGFSLSGERFDSVIWESWKCLSCGKQWTQVYGIRNE